MSFLTAPLVLNFAAYLGTALALWLATMTVYLWITPYPELKLVREGNLAAALTLSGTATGLALPLASLAEHAVSLADMAAWSVLALAVQLLLWVLIRLALFRDLARDITAGKHSVGLVVGTLSAMLGVINAACLTY